MLQKKDFQQNTGIGDSTAKVYSPITVRAVVISFLFLICITAGTQYSDLPGYWWMMSSWFMPSVTGLCLVLLMTALNYFLVKRFPRFRSFTRAEMITAYIVVMIGGYVQTISVLGFSVMNIASPWYAATLVSRPTYGPGLEMMSSLVTIKDPRAALAFWSGTTDGVPWGAWIGPIICWTVFWVVLYFSMVCLATLVRRQWTEYDRMEYPLTIPVVAIVNGSVMSRHEATTQEIPFWRNPLLYVGMAYPVIIGIFHILHNFFPAIPRVGVIRFDRVFTESPWNALLTWPPVEIHYDYAIVVGVAYMLRLQLLVSLWFFYFFAYRFLLVLFAALGYNLTTPPIIPFELGRGAYIGMVFSLLWIARRELKMVFKKAVFGAKEVDDSQEPISYRGAVFGGLAAIIFVALFAYYLLAMSPHIIGIFFFIFFTATIGYARLRAQAGYPHGQALPHYFYLTFLQGLGKSMTNMTVNDAMGMQIALQPMESGMTGSGMGMALEAYTLGDSVGLRRRSVTKLFLAAVAVALLAGYMITLPLIYRHGAINLDEYYHYSKAQVWFQYEHTPYPVNYFVSLGLGIVLSIVFSILSTNFIWWPLYPVALGIASADWMRMLWFSFFIVWLIKVVVLKYGGPVLERRLRPLFYGVIVGSVMIGIVSTVINGIRVLLA